MKLQKTTSLSRFFYLLFLLSFPLSVTLSQSAFVLSLLFLIPHWAVLEHSKRRLYFPSAFFWALGIYLSTALAGLVTAPSLGEFAKNLSRGETSDFWMVLAIPVSLFHWKRDQESDRPVLSSYLTISLGLLLVSGIASLFTPYRLGRWISLGFAYPEGERLQHFAGHWGEILTYLPIGLMNTHLTYGGLLGLLGGGFFAYRVLKLGFAKMGSKSGSSPQATRVDSSIMPVLEYLGVGTVSFAFLLLLFYNQSRSIWIGFLFLVLCLGLGLWVTHILSRKGGYALPAPKQGRASRIALVGLGVLVVVGGIALALPKVMEKNWLLQRAVQDIFAKKTTENQRYFIFRNTFSLIGDHWALGVGNNQFSRFHWKVSESLLEGDHEDLWYELTITPKGHAHHDFLHFWAVGGLPAAIAWLGFWYWIWVWFYRSLANSRYSPIPSSTDPTLGKIMPVESAKRPWNAWGMGVLVLFPAGFFQCYMLDDEVALPFYALVGILACVNLQTDQDFGKIRKLAVASLLFPLLAGLIYWRLFTLPSIDQVHQRKVTIENSQNQVQIRVEGCLSHRYGNPIEPRKDPYALRLDLANGQPRPVPVGVGLWDRDSFDQDQLYRAHTTSLLESRQVLLKPGENWLEFPESWVSDHSMGFPGTVRFRDFTVSVPEEFASDLSIALDKLCERSSTPMRVYPDSGKDWIR